MDNIEICGIRTNNLKNIDIKLKKRSINLVIGPSGSGKSSLAYDTVAQIGQHEMSSMFSDEFIEPKYKVRSYHNMLATIPIKQININNNIRSTIGTYFGINQSIALVYSALLKLSRNFFILNKEVNLCQECRGLGFISILDINRIIDYGVPLEKCPIKCWSQNKDFYTQIIKQFCISKGIDYRKNYRNLTENQKKLFLYGDSLEKYTIKYKSAGIYHTRTTKYYGVMTGVSMMPKFKYQRKFLVDVECPSCHGKKFSPNHDKHKLYELSIGEFMCTPFDSLNHWIENVKEEANKFNLTFAMNSISSFVLKAVELDLGHLSFHRPIPTLSGGELQRLRLVQVFNTQLTDLLIVLDEPLAGLSRGEKITVFNNLVKLSEMHTLLVVDHHEIFIPEAKVIIALGEKSGKNGGEKIDAEKYIQSQAFQLDYVCKKPSSIISISLNTSVYDFDGVKLEVAKNCINIIAGKSGIGKSTLLREYLPQYFSEYTYISQKALVGKRNSTVASVLDILGRITDMYAKKFKKDKQFFSKISGSKGACTLCNGVGSVNIGTEHQIMAQIECQECNGSGFNKRLKKYEIMNKSIFDIWSMTIDEAKEFFCKNDKKVYDILSNASEIMLGHLLIGQPTATLSGGENIRVKIIKSLRSKSIIYGIDEPFKGLGHKEIFCLIQFLSKLADNDKTIIVADHEEKAFRYFSKRIQLIKEKNKLIGIDYD